VAVGHPISPLALRLNPASPDGAVSAPLDRSLRSRSKAQPPRSGEAASGPYLRED